jgi:hypothetical protein
MLRVYLPTVETLVVDPHGRQPTSRASYEKAPIDDRWFLIDEATSQLAFSDKGTAASSVNRAINFLPALGK